MSFLYFSLSFLGSCPSTNEQRVVLLFLCVFDGVVVLSGFENLCEFRF